jgi:hypothetical protein
MEHLEVFADMPGGTLVGEAVHTEDGLAYEQPIPRLMLRRTVAWRAMARGWKR